MCGIVGYTGSNIEFVKKAHALQHHRGPDGEGFYSDEYISLGHNRLAIIDINPRSAQPMWDTSNRYCIIFNGEIYNYKTLREVYCQGYEFKTESDTEVILALFVKYGTDLTQYLCGMYAFTIYDSTSQTICVVRDTFGIKPLFYAQTDKHLLFSSELKAVISLLRDTKGTLTINKDNIYTYLQLGYTIAPDTLYNEIKILEAGHTLHYDIKTRTLKKTENLQPYSVESPAKVIRDTIIENTVSDVPVGVFFSGGIDSSLIVSILNDNQINLKTFTLAIENRNTDEIYSKLIAQELNITPEIINFGINQFNDIYKDFTSNIDHPAGATSLFQTGYLAKQTVTKVKVALMGDGGDELFFGYNRSFILNTLKPQTVSQGKYIEIFFLLFPHIPGKNYIFSKIFQFLKLSVSYYLLEMSVCRDSLSVKQWFTSKKIICDKNIQPIKFDQELYLKNDLLHKNDLATAFYSLEGRVPLLSEKIKSACFEVAQDSLKSHTPKLFLRNLLSQYLSPDLFDRKKLGFGIHYKSIILNSPKLKDDFESTEILLENLGIRLKSFDFYTQRSPQYCIVICCLGHALINNQRIFDTETNLI